MTGHHPIKLEIYRNLFASIVQEMGIVLGKSAYSINMKERHDYSCALFDGEGELVVMGDHMPADLGVLPEAVRAAMNSFPMRSGDVVMLNDPFSGGAHLPAITLVAPLFESSDPAHAAAFLACRARHSDMGGMQPGSLLPSTDVFQEGIRIPPLKLYSGGRLNRGLLRFLLSNVRTPVEQEGDLAAQVGCLKVGEAKFLALMGRNGRQEVQGYMEGLQDLDEKLIRQTVNEIPDGVYRADDCMDDDGAPEGANSRAPVRINVLIEIKADQMKVDFTGSSPQVQGCLNAVKATTLAAVHYVLRCLAPDDTPTSAGVGRTVEVIAPARTVVNASYPSATSGGSSETSQRIVDVLLKALASALPDRIPAASSGTMNSICLGGVRSDSGQEYAYYETLAGGMGASPSAHGDHGVHTHMTNTLNTPVEALERMLPVRVREYRLRYNSGGAGKFRGGDGIVRSIDILEDCQVSVLSERRLQSPYGLQGGAAGKPGHNYLIRKGRRRTLPGKFSMPLQKGDTLRIETPGGGGWGRPRGQPRPGSRGRPKGRGKETGAPAPSGGPTPVPDPQA